MQCAERKSPLKDQQAPRAGLRHPTRLTALREGQGLAEPERLELRVAEQQVLGPWPVLAEALLRPWAGPEELVSVAQALGLPARAH